MDTDQLQRLQLAFVMHHVQRIVDADGEESYQEYQLIGQIFPRALLEDAGFLEGGTLTQRFRDHRDMAHQVLPGLDRSARAEIFQLLYQACAIDEVDAKELRAVSEAGVALGFTEDEVTAMLVDLELG